MLVSWASKGRTTAQGKEKMVCLQSWPSSDKSRGAKGTGIENIVELASGCLWVEQLSSESNCMRTT